jgi:hypothetical protein
MTSSKLVGCSIGSSAGFAPFKDLIHVDGGFDAVLSKLDGGAHGAGALPVVSRSFFVKPTNAHGGRMATRMYSLSLI